MTYPLSAPASCIDSGNQALKRDLSETTRIPEEIWRAVFLLLYDDAGTRTRSGWMSSNEKRIFDLRHVCRSWREIADSTSGLWRLMSFWGELCPATSNGSINWLRLVFEHARSKPIAVSVRVIRAQENYPESLNELVRVILKHIQQIHTVSIVVPKGYPIPSQSMFTSLSMLWQGPRTLNSVEKIGLLALKVLRLESVSFASPEQASQLLRHCRQLRKLCVPTPVHWTGDVTIADGPELEFPELEYAELDVSFLDLMPRLPKRHNVIVAPKLQDLKLLTRVLYDPPTPIDRSRFVRVPSLALIGPFSDLYIRNLLVCTRDKLRNLSIRGYVASYTIPGFNSHNPLNLAERGRQGNFIAPSLERLEVVSDYFDNEAAMELLAVRCEGVEGCRPLHLDIHGCRETTSALWEELKRLDRGEWSRTSKYSRMFGGDLILHSPTDDQYL